MRVTAVVELHDACDRGDRSKIQRLAPRVELVFVPVVRVQAPEEQQRSAAAVCY